MAYLSVLGFVDFYFLLTVAEISAFQKLIFEPLFVHRKHVLFTIQMDKSQNSISLHCTSSAPFNWLAHSTENLRKQSVQFDDQRLTKVTNYFIHLP